MKREILSVGTKWESNTVYEYCGSRLDVNEDETVCLDSDFYLSFSERNHGCLRTAFYLCGLKNVTLDFGGAILTLHGRIQPFVIDECENVTIKNVTVEYERSFHTEFEIIDRRGEELYLRPLEKFPCRVENGYLIPYGRHRENRDLNKGDMFLQVFDTQTCDGRGLTVGVIGEEIVEGETPPCVVEHFRVREEGDAVVLTGKFPENWDNTMTIILSHEMRDVSSIYLCRSVGVTISDYRILNGAGMGVLGMYTRDITVERMMLRRDGLSHGVIANVADAVHLIACSGSIVLRDSVFEGMVDDALNVHSNYVEVEEADGNVLKIHRHKESHYIDANFKLFGAGDVISVQRGVTMEERGTAVIKDIRVTDKYHLEFTVDRQIAAESGDTVENLSTQPELTIENCVFDKANSHLRIQTRGKSRVRRCRIALPLLLTGDKNYWRESSPVCDLVIEDCDFIGPRGEIRVCPEGFEYTDSVPFYHSNVSVIGCRFDKPDAIDAIFTDNITLRDNICTSGEKLTPNLDRCTDVSCGVNT